MQVQAPGAAKVQKCAAITVTEKKKKQAGPNYVLPHPQDVELTLGLPTLVSGIVTDLIWCTGESAPTSVESYHELLALPGQLEPWLAVLDASAAVKQKDTLYKGLYKCVSILVTNPNRYGVQLVREFSMLTLQICAASSLWKQYVKVQKHFLDFLHSASIHYIFSCTCIITLSGLIILLVFQYRISFIIRKLSYKTVQCGAKTFVSSQPHALALSRFLIIFSTV